MEPAAFSRFLEFTGAALLFGLPLFRMRLAAGIEIDRATRFAAAALLIGGLVTLWFRSAAMMGVGPGEVDRAAVTLVLTKTTWGHGMAARLALAMLAIFAPARARLGLGALTLASFAFTGHGADGGLVHRIADMLHLLAAGAWLGALAGFLMTFGRERAARVSALEGFAGIGTIAVAVLVVTGVVNLLALVGVDRIPTLIDGLWGRLMIAKLCLLAVMLGCAGLNRYRFTPALASGTPAARWLNASLIVESLAGAAILGLVAILGLMEPF